MDSGFVGISDNLFGFGDYITSKETDVQPIYFFAVKSEERALMVVSIETTDPSFNVNY